MTAMEGLYFLIGVLMVLPFRRRLQGYGQALARRYLK